MSSLWFYLNFFAIFIKVLHNIIVHSQSSSPSYVISHGGLAGMRVRLRGETTWSGTLPIEDQMPNYKQHCVVQVRDISEQCLALVYCIMKFMNNLK